MKKRFAILGLVIFILTGCSENKNDSETLYKQEFVGSWYWENSDDAWFTLNEDWSCEIEGYGTGTWSFDIEEAWLQIMDGHYRTARFTISSDENGEKYLINNDDKEKYYNRSYSERVNDAADNSEKTNGY